MEKYTSTTHLQLTVGQTCERNPLKTNNQNTQLEIDNTVKNNDLIIQSNGHMSPNHMTMWKL